MMNRSGRGYVVVVSTVFPVDYVAARSDHFIEQPILGI